MSTVRNPIKRKYTVVPTTLILDDTISDRAKLLYMQLSSKADNVSFFYHEIMEELRYNSRPTLWKVFKELLENGWISRRKIQDIKGLFKNGYEFLLHETKQSEVITEMDYTEFLKTIEELDEFRCTTVEIPEDLNIQSEATDEPLDESSEWFLIKNTRKDNTYTLERLFQNKQLLTKDYFLKRKRVRTKYVDFVYLGSDVPYVNLTEWDFKGLLKRYTEKKLELMIKVLNEWLSRPENKRYKNAVRHKSCRKYFEARGWVEEKVRQKLIKERNK